MFHTYIDRIYRPARSFLTTAVTVLTLLSFLLAFVVHLTLAWSNGQAATLVLGQANFTANTADTTQTTMTNPNGVAVDPTTGKVFVAEADNNRVLRFPSLASLSNGSPAEAVLGQPDFTSSGSATTAASLNSPGNVIVDGNGRLWVADFFNNRVLRFDAAASKPNGANADGVLGQSTFTTRTNATSQARMYGPDDMALDSSGRLWVVEQFNNRVVRFDNAANKANGANADGVLGQPTFTTKVAATTQTGMSGSTIAKLDSSGRLWVADTNNNRVLSFDNAANKANGANADGVLGQSTFTDNIVASTQTGMNGPYAVGLDGNNGLWVADAVNNRVLYFANPTPPTATSTATSTPSNTATATASNTATSTPTSTATLTLSAIDTIGIYRSSTFYLRLHNSTGNADISAVFNPASKPFPIVGDWTGAGFDSIGVLDQNTGIFSLRNSNTAGAPDEQLIFGNPNDTPLSGRWLSTATHAGVGVFRSTNGILYVKNMLSTGFSDHALVLGNPGDQGIAGDWTGRGYDGLGVFRPSGNVFYLVNKVADGVIFSDINFLFGGSTDVAIAGDWVAQGHDGVGVFRPTTGNIYLRNTLTTGVSDNAFVYGVAGDQPVAGHWQVTYPPIIPAPGVIAKTAAPQPTTSGNSAPGGNQIGG